VVLRFALSENAVLALTSLTTQKIIEGSAFFS